MSGNLSTLIGRGLAKLEQRAAYYQGKGYESPNLDAEVRCIVPFVRDARVVFDVGANKALWAKSALKAWPAASLHLFEPSPLNVGILRKEVPMARVVQAAVSDKAGHSTLYANEPGSGLGSLYNRRLDHYGLSLDDGLDVQTITLDAYCDANGVTPDVLKLDIEGHELAALKGAAKILPQVKAVQFEFGGCNIDSRSFFQDFWYLFADLGFDIHRVTPLGPAKLDRYRETDEAFTIANYVAVNRHR